MLKLNPDGSAPVYSTYLGGNGFDVGNSIVLDGSGNACVAGTTASADFPTIAGAFDTTANGISDAFVTEMDAFGSGMVYSTYLGGDEGYESGSGIALDGLGNVYATGATQATDYPTSVGAFDTTANGGWNAFVTELGIGRDPVRVTIDQAVAQADPTTGSTISFDVTFAAPVTGFDASDVDFTGSTVSGTLLAGVSGSGSNYTVTVSGMTGVGNVVASIPAAAAVDGFGLPNLASTSIDNTVMFDGIAPTVSIEQSTGQLDPALTGPIEFTVHFSEFVIGFDSSDISFVRQHR